MATVTGLGFMTMENPPTDSPITTIPKIKLLGASIAVGDQSTVTLNLEFINPSRTPLSFYGYTADSFDPPLAPGILQPFYQIEYMFEGEWKPYFIGRCGVGSGIIELAAESSGTFEAYFVAPNDWQAVKISINQHPVDADPDQVTITWSRVFYRNHVDEMAK